MKKEGVEGKRFQNFRHAQIHNTGHVVTPPPHPKLPSIQPATKNRTMFSTITAVFAFQPNEMPLVPNSLKGVHFSCFGNHLFASERRRRKTLVRNGSTREAHETAMTVLTVCLASLT